MASLQRMFDISTSTLSSSLRGWRGTAAFRPVQQQPEQMLELFDMENCPFCRLVRETLCELDIDARILPCPKGGQRFRPEAIEKGGKAQFPLLHDPNTGIWLYESRDIIDYLCQTYGRKDQGLAPHSLKVVSSSLASAARMANNSLQCQANNAPAKDLELYSFESSPFSRPVRERLSELELPYILHNMAKDQWKDMGTPGLRKRLFPGEPIAGRNREALLARAGKVQVPYLIDPNTGTEMFESADILAYLDQHYA